MYLNLKILYSKNNTNHHRSLQQAVIFAVRGPYLQFVNNAVSAKCSEVKLNKTSYAWMLKFVPILYLMFRSLC